MPRDPDETMPVPGAGGGPSGDPTMPVTRPLGGPGRPPPPGGGGDDGGWDGEGEGDRRRMWFIAGGVLAVGLIIGALVAVAASGGDNTASSTSTSSTSTSTSTSSTSSSTTSTTGANPSILQFSASPSPVTCASPGNVNVTFTWATQNTSGVAISIDGPNPFGNYQPTGNTQVPFPCPAAQHTYTLTATGLNGQKVQKQLVVQGVTPPPPPPTTTTTT